MKKNINKRKFERNEQITWPHGHPLTKFDKTWPTLTESLVKISIPDLADDVRCVFY
jgi:hypothetical protein